MPPTPLVGATISGMTHNHTLDPPARVCLVCGRVLDYWTGFGWRHGLGHDPSEADDHPPVAVSPDEAGEQLRARCDFCSADEPTFVVPARSFTHGPSNSVGDWAACEACAVEIGRDAWNALLRRAVAAWWATHGSMDPAIETGLRGLYRSLRKHMTGPPYQPEDV